MKNHILLLILIFNLNIINTCDCAPLKYSEIQKMEMKYSNNIFIGEVIEINKTYFKIKVIETFKGKFKSENIISGKNTIDCNFTINENGKWLIYGKVEKGLLKVSECGLSRSFKKPYLFPPSPIQGLKENKLKNEHFLREPKLLKSEIENLRKIKKATGNNG